MHTALPICYIVGAGESSALNFTPRDDDFVIAADGGLKYLIKAGIRIDAAIGDLDSLKSTNFNNFIKLPKEKDLTDMAAAVNLGIQKGFNIFKIYCGTGGRFSHTLANVQLLTYLAEIKKTGFIYDKNGYCTVIKNDKINFNKAQKGFISVFSLSDKSLGVTLKGLKYPLTNFCLVNAQPIGTSNEFIGEEAEIEVKDGTLLIIRE